jgi:hypothetical protein
VPGDVVDYATPLGASALAPENEAVDARLQAVLELREGVEVEVEEALAVAVPDGAGEEVAEEALPVMRVWARASASKEPEGSQLVKLLNVRAALAW